MLLWFSTLESLNFGAVIVLDLNLGLLIDLVDLVKSIIEVFLEFASFVADREAARAWNPTILAV